jgi:large subunit ribosomal protein L5
MLFQKTMLLKQNYKTIIIYDLINKFIFNNIKNIPKLKKINLGLKIKSYNLTSENTIVTTGVLGFICNQSGTFATTTQAKAIYRIRKKYPIGSKITLQKAFMYDFFLKLLFNIFPRIKSFYGLFLTKEKLINSFSFKLKTRLLLSERTSLVYNELLKNIPFYTNISFTTTAKNKKELKFLLYSYKLPLIQL